MIQIEHRKWLSDSRQKMRAIVEAVQNRPLVFSWAGRDFSRQPVGCRFSYATGKDLTASVLEWWFDHQAGDTPSFFLGDLQKKLGPLWDTSVANSVWGHLR